MHIFTLANDLLVGCPRGIDLVLILVPEEKLC